MTDIQRPNYFTSQFLIEEDFNDEQAYHRDMRLRHNRLLHEWGVVTGLEVTKVGDKRIAVSEGMAMDKDGREIIVLPDSPVPKTINLDGLPLNTTIEITIIYHEIKDKPYRIGNETKYTRTTERPKFIIYGAKKKEHCDDDQVEVRTGSAPTDDNVIILARVTLDNNGFIDQVDNSVRKLASAKLSALDKLEVDGTISATNLNLTGDSTIDGSLTVNGRLEVKGDVIARDTEHIAGDVSLGDADNDQVTIAGVIRSGHSSGALRVNDGLHTTGPLTVDGNVGIGTNNPRQKLEVNGTVKATRFEGDGSGLTGISAGGETKWSDGGSNRIYYNAGNVGIGTNNPSEKLEVDGAVKAKSLTIEDNLTVNGNIKTTGMIRGSSMPPNLIRNSYMNILDGNKPAGYTTLGNVTLEAAHPFTKGFEGPYVGEKPANAADSVDDATEENPYWFGRVNKGSRIKRGGLADGWAGFRDGRILKITGDNSAQHTVVLFPFECKGNFVTKKYVHFKAWLKISSGKQVGFGEVAGWYGNRGGLFLTKEQSDKAPDGWYRVDGVIPTSEVTRLGGQSFSMGIVGDEADGSFEVYLALPYLANLDNDSWLPSVSDLLSRDGLTVHPSSGNVGIGTTDPSQKLEVDGIVKATRFVGDGSGLTGIRAGGSTKWSDGRSNRIYYNAGNVGIGTNNPSQKLEVAGTVKATKFEGDGSVGTAELANNSVTNQKIANNAVNAAKIQDGTVGTAELANNSVTNAKIANDAVNAAKIQNGSVGNGELANNSVTNQKIANDAVNAAKIQNGTVGTAELANNSVTNAKIANNSVNAAKIQNGTVGTAELANNSVTNQKIANNAVNAAKIQDGTVGTAELANNSVTNQKIANNAVNAAKIQDGTVGTAELANNSVTNQKIANNAVNAAKIQDGTVGTAELANNSVTNQKIANDAVNAAKIQNGTVGTAELANNSVTNQKIANNAVNAAKIQNGTVGTAELANNSVTNAKIANNAVNAAKIQDGTVGTAELANKSVTNAKIADKSISMVKLDDVTRNQLDNASQVQTLQGQIRNLEQRIRVIERRLRIDIVVPDPDPDPIPDPVPDPDPRPRPGPVKDLPQKDSSTDPEQQR
ncbi:MAG: hypothetical protein F6J90_29435 [Moorea sp. SIOASIH]|uniref:hypothetical protein n=1 Tax=Moorena sp. SIOASIH TaxID=2607817 RepID=UPI0013B92669|nr:hypothetical protein [Moorena sp. SIOASIH]NEO40246.1 hypothetical protein [Moorena sp. SIOASIH]